MSLQPNWQDAWNFLDRMHPGRPRVVTALYIDGAGEGVPTRTFGPDDYEAFASWCEDKSAAPANLYFSVAEPVGPMTRKMRRSDVQNVHWLHVDVDPDPDAADLLEEQKRILALLREPDPVPPPTIIIFSGGGFQAFWRLESPIHVGGSNHEDAESMNRWIQHTLKADACHDVSRIMRLPGSLNQPDRKKRERGRTTQLARVVDVHEDRVYGTDAFGHKSDETHAVPVVASKPRLDDDTHVPELGLRASPDLRREIRGPLPNEDRSEWLLSVARRLVQCHIDDDTIVSVLTNPAYPIHELCNGNNRGPEAYARRQAERAREFAKQDPLCQELNERFAVVENYGGRCVVIEEVDDPILQRSRLTKQTFGAFRDRFSHKKLVFGEGDKARRVTIGDWWLQHWNRRQYEKVVFAPAQPTPGAYNLWKGFAVEPSSSGTCELFLSHLRDVVCSGIDEHYEYLLGWMARTVQYPNTRGEVAVVMRGRMGTGKGAVANTFGALFGRHFIPINRPEHLVGNFNAHLRDCVVLFADEAFFAGDKKAESVLKSIVTEPALNIEQKGMDTEVSANCVHLMMASNEQWVVPTGPDDRRYFVLDVSSQRMGDREYFKRLFEEIENGGMEALLYYLQNYDLSGFDVREFPRTEAWHEQKMLSLNDDHEWWLQILQRGYIMPDNSTWPTEVPVEHLTSERLGYARQHGRNWRSSGSRMNLLMDSLMPGKLRIEQSHSTIETIRPDGAVRQVSAPWCYKIPPLQDCRDYFDRNFGGPYEWPDVFSDEDVARYEDSEAF